MSTSKQLVRCAVVWFPEWPVTAWIKAEGGSGKGRNDEESSGERGSGDDRVIVVEANRVISCSAAAHAEGVRRGQRRREAQSCCPTVQIVPVDADRDHRMFAPLVDRLEEVSPGVQLIRPGLAALRMRGPARYYGGEEPAVNALLEAMAQAGVPDVKAGIADGLFAAEQAAYDPARICVVEPEKAAEFLAPLPVNRLGDAELTSLLPRLGVHRLGEFAALDVEQVRDRFGEHGVRLRALAAGEDPRAFQPRTPPVELARQIEFTPALELADQVAFSIRATAEEFIVGLGERQLVCTELRVELTAEEGERSERVWLHPAAFDPAAVVDRVRWQLQAAAGVRIHSGVARVRLEPVAVDAAHHHAPGLFGTGPDERVHHALSRVQAMLGADGVLTAVIGGGRGLAERQVLVPWGERAVLPMPPDRPWPGHVPTPLPSTVFETPRAMTVLSAEGDEVVVDERGVLSSSLAVLIEAGRQYPITAWAGPWPVDEHPWDPARRRRIHRFQVVDDTQTAWLLLCDATGNWQAEARYD